MLRCHHWRSLEGKQGFLRARQQQAGGTEEMWEAPEGTYVSETVVAPKLGSTGDDDAYLLTFSSDVVNDVSHCEIFDATDPAPGPIVRVKLPERISSGTHATWAPADQL
ncbi:MAG: carotenoid oxygenase family protein [Acidimicrobiales bacterium]